MIRTHKLLAGAAAAVLALGVAAGLLLGTSTPASACSFVASQDAAPSCGGGGNGTKTTITATPSEVAPGDPITLTMTVTYSDGTVSDLTAGTTFSLPYAAGSCTGNVCTPTTTGSLTLYGQFTAPYTSYTTSTTVTVVNPDHITVDPVYTNAVAGQTIAYTVRRAAADGTILDDATSRATVTLGGVPCPGAVCTATTVGQHTLTATVDDLTAGGAVMVLQGPAASLVVTPHVSSTLNNVTPASFTVEGYDAGGNDLGDVTGASTFAISPDGSCSGNYCTAATAGPHTVTATSGAASGSATVDATGPIPTILPSLPSGQVGTRYSASVLGFHDRTTTAQATSALPPGLTLSPAGVLSGTPTAAGTWNFIVSAANKNGGEGAWTTITIAPAPVLPTVSASRARTVEGNSGQTTVSVPITLSAASSSPVTVAWRTADKIAVAGSDYVAASGTLTIPAGQTTASVQVTVIGDTAVEPNEPFQVVLSRPTGATLGTAKGIVTIANDD